MTPACHPIIHAWVERRSRDDRTRRPDQRTAQDARLKTRVQDQGSRPGSETRNPGQSVARRRNKDRGPRLHARSCWGSAGIGRAESRETGRRVCIILNSPMLRPLPGRCVPWARPPGPCPPGSVPPGPSSWARPPWVVPCAPRPWARPLRLVPAPIPDPSLWIKPRRVKRGSCQALEDRKRVEMTPQSIIGDIRSPVRLRAAYLRRGNSPSNSLNR